MALLEMLSTLECLIFLGYLCSSPECLILLGYLLSTPECFILLGCLVREMFDIIGMLSTS